MNPTLDTQIKKLTGAPGVYRFYDKDDRLLYIGKAKNLKNRVSSYFVHSKTASARIRLLVRKIHRLEYTIVPSEKDALLLENALIKEHQPRYNILLKDDKSFPYIAIVNEPFPRIFLTRQQPNDGSEYFGPFTSVKYVRSNLELIKSLYPIRSCALNLDPKTLDKKNYKVCLEFHLGNCLGPCEMKQSESDYMENIRQIRQILMGKTSQVKALFKAEMQAHADAMEFEQANEAKKKIETLTQYEERSYIVHPKLGNLHVFGICQAENRSFVHYFRVDNGTIIGSRNIGLKHFLEEERPAVLAFAIDQIVGAEPEYREVIVQEMPLTEREDLNFSIPQRGEKKKLLDLAVRNALLFKKDATASKPLNKNEETLVQMKEDLRLKDLPFHIECFDNSNLQGSNPTASVVVFKNARPSKGDYRHYKIRTVTGPDDFASMEEVVYRRYKRLLEEDAPLPQLIVIDGGKGQLSSAYKSLERLGLIGKLQVVSIAKRLEEIYYPHDQVPLHISKKSVTLRVLQHIRNEAHRFAINFHRDLRSKAATRSELTEIAGVGEKSMGALLQRFKSVNRLSKASLEEIKAVVGPSRAQKVYDHFHP